MKIVLLKGSPHKNGSSNLLAEQFQRGAEEAGHQAEGIDVGNAAVHPCMGCGACGMSGNCVHRDDMAEIKKQILSADMLVFVTPVYYFGMSAQLKAVIDRFYSFNSQLSGKRLKTALITAAWDNSDQVMFFLKEHYRGICEYLGFLNQGMVLGKGCGSVQMTKQTKYPEEAYQLGKSLK